MNEWNRELTPLLLPKAWWSRWIVSNPAQNQYCIIIQMIYLLSVDHGIIHFRTSYWISIIWILCFDFFFFLVLLLCVAESVWLSAAATSGACAPALASQTMAAVQTFLYLYVQNSIQQKRTERENQIHSRTNVNIKFTNPPLTLVQI